MTIDKTSGKNKLTLAVAGRLDTTTARELSQELDNSLDGINELVFDFKNLTYISSSGLRVLLSAQKTMNNKKGTMVVKNVSDIIMEIFEVTGFSDILTIK